MCVRTCVCLCLCVCLLGYFHQTAADDHEQCPVALLQRDSFVELRSQGSKLQVPHVASPQTWGTTFFSTDPEASANYFVRYFKAVRVPLPGCSAPRAAVKLTTAEAENGLPLYQMLVFVNDVSQSVGAWNATQAVSEAAALILNSFGKGQPLYTPWIDNHNGYQFLALNGGTIFNLELALADGMPMMAYVEGFGEILRLYIPGTLWTIQVADNFPNELMKRVMHTFGEQNPDACRVEGESSMDRTGWAKSTWMAADPAVAAKFMIEVLGAVQILGDYRWPPVANCTAAQWVLFPEIMFEVHFVLSQEWQLDGFSIEEQVQAMDGTQALESGQFATSMYNSLVLSVPSLDVYVPRLQAQSVPYMLMRINPKEYALFMIIPENAITVQLRSQHLSVETPVAQGMCTQDFGNLTF